MGTSTRTALAGLGAALLVASIAAPVAAAGAPAQDRSSTTYEVAHDCGIVERTTATLSEKAFFEGGTWVRSIIQFRFEGTFTGPAGKTYSATSHQTGTFTPTTGALSGQGSFLRGAGGVLVMDAGRLVFDAATGETLQASARVLRWDDPANPGAFEAALCARLG